MGSKNGFVASSHLAHYNASKGGLELLTRSLAIELGAHGITCNNLDPGDVVTEILEEEEIDGAFWDYLKEHIPLEGRLAQADEIAYAAVFMASEAGAYMTGQSLVLDGGVLCQQMPRLQFMAPYANTVGAKEHGAGA